MLYLILSEAGMVLVLGISGMIAREIQPFKAHEVDMVPNPYAARSASEPFYRACHMLIIITGITICASPFISVP